MPVSEATLAEINDLIEIQTLIRKACTNNLTETYETLEKYLEKYKSFIESQIALICRTSVKIPLFEEFARKHNMNESFYNYDAEVVKIAKHFNEDNIDFLAEQSSTTKLANATFRYSNGFEIPYLNLAAESGAIKMFKYLLSEGCEPDSRTMNAAITGGSLEIIQLLAQNGLSIKGYATIAIINDQNEIYEWISNNSDDEINFTYNSGSILESNVEYSINYLKSLNKIDDMLFRNIIVQRIPVYVKFIFENGIIVENIEEMLDFALCVNNIDAAVVLSQRGCKITNFFEHAIQAIEAKNDKLWDFLVDNGLDIKLREPRSQLTLLHVCTKKGFGQKIDFLTDGGIDVNSIDAAGKTPLMYASENTNVDNVKKLISRGADVNILDNAGETALFYAASQGLTGIIQLLFENGAKANITSKRGHTPYVLASFINKDAADLISKHLQDE